MSDIADAIERALVRADFDAGPVKGSIPFTGDFDADDWMHVATRDRQVLAAELKRLHSWDGLMSLLDEHWPADIFITAPKPEDYHEPLYRLVDGEYVRANPGVIITGLIRWVDRLTREAENASRDHIAEIQEMEREHSAEINNLHREHSAEMNEAGAELRAMERDLERAERDAEQYGGMGGRW